MASDPIHADAQGTVRQMLASTIRKYGLSMQHEPYAQPAPGRTAAGPSVRGDSEGAG